MKFVILLMNVFMERYVDLIMKMILIKLVKIQKKKMKNVKMKKNVKMNMDV